MKRRVYCTNRLFLKRMVKRMSYGELSDLDISIDKIKAVIKRTYQPGWNLKMPSRPNPGLYFTLSGLFNIIINNREYEVPPGHIIVLSDADEVLMSNCTQDVVSMVQFTFYAHEPLHFSDLHISSVMKDSAEGKYLALFEKADDLFTRQPAAYRIGLRSILEEIIRNLVLDGNEPLSQSKIRKKLWKATSYISENYMKPICLDDLCSITHYSPSQLRNIFYREIGVSPIRYLHRVRLDHACTLLRETDLTVQCIAERTGFESSPYFCRIFIKHMGCTPTEYRSSTLTPLSRDSGCPPGQRPA